MPPPGKGRAPLSRDVLVSKALSRLLRHAAEKEGLKMDEQGYANVADVVCFLYSHIYMVSMVYLLNWRVNS